MEYYDIGDKINRADLNSLVYLLRKFKKLTTNLKIGSSTTTEYGELHFSDGFKSTGSNWIIEEDVMVTSNNVLKNSFYSFIFTVFDKNLSGNVNYRTVTVTSDSTGDDGILEVEIPTEVFEDDDIILTDYQLEIVFDEHEYYTPLTNYNVTLTVEKDRILVYEDNTIYLTLKQGAEVVPYALTSIIINNEEFFATTNDEGVAEFIYTGKGAGRVDVTTPLDNLASVSFYDNPDYVTAVFTGSTVTLGATGGNWLINEGTVIIEWGDGNTSKVNNPSNPLTHTYSDGQSRHEVKFIGNVTGLGVNTFKECTNLESVVLLPELNTIGNGCFYGCTALSSIILPANISELGSDCFRGCTSLNSITIPDNVTIIGDRCFYLCTGLESVSLHNNITEIGSYCFNTCSNLTGITLPESLAVLKSDCFRNCSTITDITIPLGVNIIEANCFRNCTGITEINIPNTVEELGDYVFYGCNSLESIVLSENIDNLPSYLFYGCTALETINIPTNISSIGAYCFRNCDALTSIVIPNHVSNLGENCFDNCDNLTSVTIPESVQVIGNNAFYRCSSLTDYYLNWTEENKVINYNDANLINNTNTKFTIPNKTYDYYANKEYPIAKLVEKGYRLVLNSNKEVFLTGETATATATLLNNGNPVANKTLNYTVKHGGTIISSGTKTTNSNGQANISYTGTGIGEVEITFTYSNIAEKTIMVYDVLKYDTATISDHTDSFWASATNIVRNNEYSSIGSSSTVAIYSAITGDICIELDVQTNTFNTGTVLRVANGSTVLADLTRQVLELNQNEWKHVKITIRDNKLSVDGTSVSDVDVTGFNRLYLRSNSGYGIDFKNIKIYSLNYGKSINIKVNKPAIYTDESITLTGTVLNDGFPVTSANVTIYQDDTSIGTVTTDNNGKYSKTITGLTANNYTFKAVYDNTESNTISITVSNHNYDLSIASNKNTLYTDETVTISGVLTKDNTAYANQTITIYDGNTSIGTVTTNTNGAYTKTITGLSAGSHTFKTKYGNITSSNVTVTVNNHTYNLTASASKTTLYNDESTVISGVLKKDNNVWGGQKVKIYDGTTLLDTITTNSNGAYSKTVTGLTAGNHTFKVQHTNVTSSNVSVTVNNHSYTLSCSVSKSVIYNNESVTVTGTLKRDGSVYANQQVTIYQNNVAIGNVTTNNNGVYSKTVTGLSVGDYVFKTSSNGVISGEVNVRVNKHTYSVTASANKSSLYVDESVTVSGVLTKDGNVYANQAVTIYDGSTSKGTATTNSSGAYSKTLSGLTVGNHSIKAGYSGISSSIINLTVNNHSYSLTCSLDKISMDSDETLTITGNLKKDSSNWSNQTITIYDGNTIIATVSTNSSGNYSKSISGFSTGSHSIRAVHSSVQSANVGLTVNAYSIGISASSTSIYSDGSVTVTGVLTKNGSAWGGQSVTVYDGSTSKGTVTTDSNGRYSMTLSSLSAGSHSFKAVNMKVESGTVNVTVSNHSYSLSASASATSISYGQSVTLSGVLKRDNVVWASQTITVYDGSTSLGTVTTDGNGNYSKTITGLSAGSHTLKASHSNVQSSNVGVTVNNIYSLTASLSSASIYTDGSTVISGVLKKNNAVWSGQTITIYDGTTSKGTVTTDANGAYSKTLSSLSAGTHTLKASHTNTSSGNVSLTVRNHSYSLTASASKSSIYTDETVTVSGVLKKDNAVWASQTITVYDGSTSKGTATTNNSGAYSKAVSGLSAGTHTLKAQHTNATSGNMSVTVKNHSYNLTCTASGGSINYGQSVTISGALKKDNANWGGQTVTLREGNTVLATVTTDSNGAYSKSISGLSPGSHSINAIHTNVTSGTASVTVNDIYALTCSASSTTINYGESVTISGNLKKNNANWSGQTITIKEGNTTLATVTTDSNGAYSKNISGLSVGSHSINAVHTNATSGTATVTVKATEKIIATFTGSSITMGDSNEDTAWLISNGDATIDWGDSTTSTVNNRISPLSHTFTNGSGSHTVKFSGNITGIGPHAFSPNVDNPELTSIEIKDGVTSIGMEAFYGCVNLASVIIPSTVTSIGRQCFYSCSSLSEYNLYWTTSSKIIAYDSSKMPITSNGKFKIPRGTTSLYTSKGYPSAKLQERS